MNFSENARTLLPLSADLIEEARRLRDSGLSWYAVGLRLGRTGLQIRLWLDPEYRGRKRLVQRTRRRERSGTGIVRKRTPELEAEARELLASGMTKQAAADRLGVSRATIHRWTDLDYRARDNAVSWQAKLRRAGKSCDFACPNATFAECLSEPLPVE